MIYKTIALLIFMNINNPIRAGFYLFIFLLVLEFQNLELMTALFQQSFSISPVYSGLNIIVLQFLFLIIAQGPARQRNDS